VPTLKNQSTASATNTTRAENIPLGGFLIMLAFFCLAIMAAFAKAAYRVPTATLVFFQNFLSLLLFLPWILQHGIGELKTSRPGMHFVRALGGMLAQVLLFVAVKRMPLMDAVLLAKSAPLFIPIVGWLWLREKIGGSVWASLVVGFAGIVLILRPNDQMLSNPWTLIATGSAICSATALVTVNRLSNDETPRRILFYYFLIASVLTAPFSAAAWQRPTEREWMYLIGIGLFMAIAQLLIILAYRQASAGRIAPYNYSVVVFSGLIGWAVWKDTPGWNSVAGVVLVIAGSILSTKFGGPNHRGHWGWLGHWNHRLDHEQAREQQTA
jgi:drug/metabolite transporter (DMT)-like permease